MSFDEIVDISMTEEQIMNHLYGITGEIEVKRNPDLVKCPRADKCVMDCFHKTPHVYEEKHCNDEGGKCGIKCVHELISDCTFFEDDFEIE
jgi:hypothetical protein